jgi:large subunit ribosomal protein L13
MKTYSVKKSEIKKEWFIVDAEGQTLGRLATKIAHVLRGKHKPIYTPHLDVGDFIVVINAEKIRLTGRKWEQKNYYRHSNYPGGLTTVPAEIMLKEKPTELIRHAVKGMLPKGSLGRAQLKKLKIYAGSEHQHDAQQPRDLPDIMGVK